MAEDTEKDQKAANNGSSFKPSLPRQNDGTYESTKFGLYSRIETTVAPYSISWYGLVSEVPRRKAFYVLSPPAVDHERHVPEVGSEVTAAIYLDTDDPGVQDDVLRRVQGLANLLGYESEHDAQVRRGSIFRRSALWVRRTLGSAEVTDRLVKVERALELVALDKHQAEYDSQEASAVRELLESLAGIERACLRVGSILIVKYPVGTESAVFVRNLSQVEIRTLERYPEIQARPEGVFGALATAISAMDPQPADASGLRAAEGS